MSDRAGSPGLYSLGIPAAWLALCLIWSSTWLAIKVGLADLPPISFCALRFVIASGVLLLICLGRFPSPRRLADYWFLALTGFLTFGVNYGLLFWGEQHVSSGLAAILQATIPSFGLIFAHFMLPAEPMRWERITGATLALGGVVLICIKLLDFHGRMAFWGGVAIVLGAAIVAYANVLIKARDTRFVPAVMAAWQMLFALLPLLLLGFWMEGSPLYFHWTTRAVGCLLYLALVVLLAAQSCRGHQPAHHLAHHASARGRVWLAGCTGNIIALVIVRRSPGVVRRSVNFMEKRPASKRGGPAKSS